MWKGKKMISLWKGKKMTSLEEPLLEKEKRSEELSLYPFPFPYKELRSATFKFSDSHKIGSGSTGTVYHANLRQRKVVIKKLFPQVTKRQSLHEFLDEVKLMGKICHQNLLQLEGFSLNGVERSLVYRYAENGSLANALWGPEAVTRSKVLGWRERLLICKGIAHGLVYLHNTHEPSIIHENISATNILLDANQNPLITDFGLVDNSFARCCRDQTGKTCQNLSYKAPEYSRENPACYTCKTDVFSFGAVMLEIISGRNSDERTRPRMKPSPSLQLEILPPCFTIWVLELRLKGKYHEMLQPNVPNEGQLYDKIMKVLHIALSCFHPYPERRPSMVDVESMLIHLLDSC